MDLTSYLLGKKAGGGATDYSVLENKPSINNVELVGNKTTSDLGINIPEVKTTTSTTSGAVYDVTYINTMLGNVESLLSEV